MELALNSGTATSRQPGCKRYPLLEFGKLVKVQEVENQIITHYKVYDERRTDSALLVSPVGIRVQQMESAPRIVVANAERLEETGVKTVSVPAAITRSE